MNDKITIIKTNNPKKYSRRENIFTLSKFEHMDNFGRFIKKLQWDKPYTVSIKGLCFPLKRDNLVGANSAPVGLLRMIYDLIVRCEIRDKEEFDKCCSAPCCCSSCDCLDKDSKLANVLPHTWYGAFRFMMIIIFLFVLAVLWEIQHELYGIY